MKTELKVQQMKAREQLRRDVIELVKNPIVQFVALNATILTLKQLNQNQGFFVAPWASSAQWQNDLQAVQNAGNIIIGIEALAPSLPYLVQAGEAIGGVAAPYVGKAITKLGG